jgi:hypothetical protein
VNFDDYVRIDTGFNTGLTGWLNGDFNYSGSVNFDDYVLIDIAFNSQNSVLRRQSNSLKNPAPHSRPLRDAVGPALTGRAPVLSSVR